MVELGKAEASKGGKAWKFKCFANDAGLCGFLFEEDSTAMLFGMSFCLYFLLPESLF